MTCRRPAELAACRRICGVAPPPPMPRRRGLPGCRAPAVTATSAVVNGGAASYAGANAGAAVDAHSTNSGAPDVDTIDNCE